MSAALPYRESDDTRTTGWSGTDTSRERALRENKTAGAKQRLVLQQVSIIGAHGITVAELCEATGWHHGTASGVLSNLDKAGVIVMLEERRDRQHVYTLSRFKYGRDLAKRRVKQHADILDAQAYILFEQQRQNAARRNVLGMLGHLSWSEQTEITRATWREEARSIIEAAESEQS